MKGFERYDVQGWLENGLSFHPEIPTPVQTQRRHIHGYIARMMVPLIAMTTFGASVARAEGAWPALQASNAFAQRQFVIAARSPPIVWDTDSGLVPHALAVDAFEAYADSLIAEVRAGTLTNVPSHTLMLATKAVGRYADTDPAGRPDWVDKVASEVAKLTD